MILAQYKSNIQDFTVLKLSDGYSSHPPVNGGFCAYLRN